MKHQHEASPSRRTTSCKILFLTQNAYLLSVSLLSTLSPFADQMTWIMTAVTLNSLLFSPVHTKTYSLTAQIITQPALLALKEFCVLFFVLFWGGGYLLENEVHFIIGQSTMLASEQPTQLADRDSIYFLKHNADCCLCIRTPGVSGKGRSVSVNKGSPFTC